VLEEPGIFDFAMLGVRPDDLEGAIKVRIQPSEAAKPGIWMNINDEFLPPEDKGKSSDMADLFESLWPEAEKRATTIRAQLLEQLVP
jgi:hypothetical protein